MTPDDQEQIESLFERALGLPPARRSGFLRQSGADAAVIREVESLLQHSRSETGALRPVIQNAAALPANTERESDSRNLIGRCLGPYRISSLVGRGGMGEIYAAEDTRLGRKVALKLLPELATENAARVRRFHAEARAISALNHPNIVTIHDFGHEAGIDYIVTEFVEGQTLRQILSSGPQSPREALKIATQIASALATANAAGIVHRDLKPENVMLRPDGYVKVLDFGLAKLREPQDGGISLTHTRPGIVMGTMRYMSPEHLCGGDIDARSDLFSLGVVMYELMTGRTPFTGASYTELMAAIVDQDPAPMEAGLPPRFEAAIRKCLEKDREQRYQTSAELLADLEKLKPELEAPPAARPNEAAPLPEAAVSRQLEKLVASKTLANAERLRNFLDYVVRETLAGRSGAIKEYAIGREVCGRPDSFDPKADPIVRVDASRLRTRLEAYYQSEGQNDEVLIDLPKGCYVPVFKPRAAPAAGAAETVSLAVLPFVSLSRAGDQDEISDSLTEELIHALARMPGLRVISPGSVFPFKNRSIDGREAGKRLKVAHVLEGSVRLAGDRLRVTAQLVDVTHGWLLWSEKFERPWASVFSVQDEITAAIAQALRIKLTGEHPVAPALRVTDDPEAYADYLRGRYFSIQRTADSLTRSVRCFERALARDPACAPAYAGLADSLLVMAINDQERTLSLMPRARAASNKALELRPGYPEALVSLGCVKSIFDWDWGGGARDLREAAQRQPDSALAHHMYAVFNLQARGQWTEALDRMNTALRLDPVSHVTHRDLGLIHFMRRAWDEAERAWRQAEELAPGYRGCEHWRARMDIETGNFERALASLEARWKAGPPNTRVLATIGYAYARRGDEARAHEIFEELRARSRQERVPPLNLAIVLLGLRECEPALEWLEKACEERAAALYQYAVDPLYDSIRRHPRAEAVRLAMGLKARESGG